MDDETWDDDDRSAPTATSGVPSEGGKPFSAGRGYKPASQDTWGKDESDDPWGNKESSSNGWNNSNDNFNNNSNRGFRSGRGDGRRGGRGGGRGGRNERGNDNGWNDAEESKSDDCWGEDRPSRGGGRGRGGRGGGRGGMRGGGEGDDNFHGNRKENDGNDEKPREHYVPVERATDEDLFTQTISSGINFIRMDDITVNVTGDDAPQNITSFAQSGLRPILLENVAKSGYTKPTPIQKWAIPVILGGRDLMGCAQTGSGKTAAFLLPIIHKLLESQEGPVVEDNCCQPRAIIVSPTRELTMQIYEQAKKFAFRSIIKTVVAYGGTSVFHQKGQILNGCHILVATPGRLNDFVEKRVVSFASLQFLVLDEADRMLDMGFLPTVEKMIEHPTMSPTGEHQTLMFSATFPEEIQHLAAKFLNNYIFISVGIIGSASTDVEQVIYQVDRFNKRQKLLEILKENKNKKVVVFVETKRTADFLAAFLSESDVQSTSIHGDRLQREREEALWDFRKGIRKVLVATNVAARGLDIEGIDHVVNYDLPKSIDEYVHRIGRTGRVGNRGKATSFYDPQGDRQLAGGLAKILKQAGQEVPNWLGKDDFGGADGMDDGAFGGRDIRDDFGRAQNVVDESTVDEEW